MTGQVTRRDIATPVPEGADGEGGRGSSITDAITRDVVRWAISRNLAPVALSGFSLGFGVIAAVWLTGISGLAEVTAVAALLVSYLVCRAARVYGAGEQTAALDWAQGACVLLAELAVYAGIAGGASANAAASAGTGLTGPVGDQLRGTFAADLGGPGIAGVWRLAVAAAVLVAVREMAGLCAATAQPGEAAGVKEERSSSGGRLVPIGLVFILAGPRMAFAAAGVLGAFALVARIGVTARANGIVGYRGDGPLSVWIGSFAGGRLPPLPPLVVGLLVTGVLTGLGLGNLPGILVFTPAEAMLLAALGSWHAHDGPHDWLAPALLQAGEYVFLAALGFVARVPPVVTLALLAAVAMRHFDLAYRARNRLSPAWFIGSAAWQAGRKPTRLPGADWRGLGWEGRMIVACIAFGTGILPYAYPALALYLWALLARDALTGWSARHAPVNR